MINSVGIKLYAFDVDETLEVSGGPIKLCDLLALRQTGHIVGLCGNWAAFVNCVPNWHLLISFLGPLGLTKEQFLHDQLLRYIPVDEIIMVGNILGVSGMSDDCGAAHRAGVRFISETEFSAGER